MGVKVTNNAFGTISAGINSSATTVTLDSGQGARFPTLGGSDHFYGTLIDTSNNVEIIKVTARSSDSMTVTRAQDNTSARAFSIGDRFELRPVAKLFEDILTEAVPAADTIVNSMIATDAVNADSIAANAVGASELNVSGNGSSGQALVSDADGTMSWATIASYADSDALSLFNVTGSAPVYAVRAWINFDGTGTVSIRGSANVSSLTDVGTGNYRVNLSSALPDTNYSGWATGGGATTGSSFTYHGTIHSRNTTNFGVNTTAYNIGTQLGDLDTCYCGIVR